VSLNFDSTLNGRVVVSDAQDENAPLLKLECCNEWADVPIEIKVWAAQEAVKPIEWYLKNKKELKLKALYREANETDRLLGL